MILYNLSVLNTNINSVYLYHVKVICKNTIIIIIIIIIIIVFQTFYKNSHICQHVFSLSLSELQ